MVMETVSLALPIESIRISIFCWDCAMMLMLRSHAHTSIMLDSVFMILYLSDAVVNLIYYARILIVHIIWQM